MGLIQPPIQWVPGGSFTGGNAAEMLNKLFYLNLDHECLLPNPFPFTVHDVAMPFISTAYMNCSWKSVVNSFRPPTQNYAGQKIEEKEEKEEKDVEEDGWSMKGRRRRKKRRREK
jgi:hypothetical protein